MSNLSTISAKYFSSNLVQHASNTVLPQIKDNILQIFDPAEEQNDYIFDADKEIDSLKNEFQSAKDSQGIFGKIFDGIKNLFGTKYSSRKVNKAIEDLSSASDEEEIKKVRERVTDYQSKQARAVDTITMTGTSIAIISGGAKLAKNIANGLGRIMSSSSIPANGKLLWLLTLASSVFIGATANVCLHQVENMTDNIDKNSWHNDKNLGEEISSGAVSGLILTLYMSISRFVSNPIKKLSN